MARESECSFCGGRGDIRIPCPYCSGTAKREDIGTKSEGGLSEIHLILIAALSFIIAFVFGILTGTIL